MVDLGEIVKADSLCCFLEKQENFEEPAIRISNVLGKGKPEFLTDWAKRNLNRLGFISSSLWVPRKETPWIRCGLF